MVGTKAPEMRIDGLSDPDEVAHYEPTPFAFKSLTSQYDTAWSKLLSF